ncbi:MAG: PDZ domain-containing protein [Polyangiaceae bacterium]
MDLKLGCVTRSARLAFVLAGAVALTLSTSCAAIFPEIATRLSAFPASRKPDPPAPQDRHFVRVVSGHMPKLKRDGQPWDGTFGTAADPYAILKVNGVEVIHTKAASNTFDPKWGTESPCGNFAVVVGDKLRIELWHDGALVDTPVGVAEATLSADMIDRGAVDFDLSGEARVSIQFEEARPIWGAGFWFELRNEASYVTRLIDGSPASRAGIVAGDRILSIDGKKVAEMSTGEVQSKLSAIPAAGLALTLQHAAGGTLEATVKEGPIFPLFADSAQLSVQPSCENKPAPPTE